MAEALALLSGVAPLPGLSAVFKIIEKLLARKEKVQENQKQWRRLIERATRLLVSLNEVLGAHPAVVGTNPSKLVLRNTNPA